MGLFENTEPFIMGEGQEKKFGGLREIWADLEQACLSVFGQADVSELDIPADIKQDFISLKGRVEALISDMRSNPSDPHGTVLNELALEVEKLTDKIQALGPILPRQQAQ